ncbi:carbohydrate ABC transporter permease [Sedimentibacter saalensis]|jgi:multiple sugar transport system permease protein|uniref:carbohydrate ABC transporter permease n=1 Tax=Sedimentibacter saalensis TaxID=130788 RepID=UPI00289CB60C|nr:carbohydrate ABC transporter permease [Sedimentibacter saalensis]MEA5096196.1 carbohydrate ABC transporter permease [Sedimentibacter saalensis]
MKQSKKSIVLSYAVLAFATLIVLLPFFWMLVSSFKSQRELFAYPPKFLPSVWKWENYKQVLSAGSISFFQMFLNSMKVTLPVVVLNITFSSLAAYAFARINFPFKNFIFMMFISSMMIPAAVVMIPRFMLFTNLKLVDTYWPLILPSAFGTAFSIFLLRQFFMTIPKDLEEAAVIDGCGKFRIWATIIVPLSKPIIATLSVFLFQGTYNDFMGPLIYLNTDTKFTIQLGLASFRNSFATRYDLIMAGSMLALIPVLIIYIVCQKYIVKGIVMSGLKG